MFTLKTYNGQFPDTNRIFILNKGNNAGKPSLMPFVNSFVLTTSTEEEAQLYYFLCYALWKGRKFRQLLIGSVILFIRKDDLYKEISRYKKLLSKKSDFMNAVHKIMDLEKLLVAKRKQLNKMEELKSAILINYIS
jgi:hypothetical protein